MPFFNVLEFQGPYGPLENSSPCGGIGTTGWVVIFLWAFRYWYKVSNFAQYGLLNTNIDILMYIFKDCPSLPIVVRYCLILADIVYHWRFSYWLTSVLLVNIQYLTNTIWHLLFDTCYLTLAFWHLLSDTYYLTLTIWHFPFDSYTCHAWLISNIQLHALIVSFSSCCASRNFLGYD